MPAHWYALHSKPRKEDFLWGQGFAHEIESFYPRIRVQRVNPRARKIRPYFPGYLFIFVDLEKNNLSSFKWMPGASELVSFDGEPTHVSDGLIHAIRQRVEEINAAGGELFENLKQGEPVVIQDGPFVGYKAIFDARLPGSERVRVLLKLIQNQQMRLELPAAQVQRTKRR